VTIVLRTAIGDYPHTAPVRLGQVSSPSLVLDLLPMPVINRAFAPMVRDLRFDVCEMAIATLLQALSFGKPLMLLPVVLAARFQEPALLCQTNSPIKGPADLVGRRVGIRAYSQTTGVWLRGILTETFGITPEQICWVTIEDAHVVEYRDPAWTRRAPPGSELLAMLRTGALDAVVVGNDMPDGAGLRPVFPDLSDAARSFLIRYGFMPVNHVLTIRREIAERQPDVAAELLRMFDAAASIARDRGVPGPDVAGLQGSVALALRYATEQGLLGRHLDLEEAWPGTLDGLPPLSRWQAPNEHAPISKTSAHSLADRSLRH
jgi:4,5-dihydroxyphthalate decarboxylase